MAGSSESQVTPGFRPRSYADAIEQAKLTPEQRAAMVERAHPDTNAPALPGNDELRAQLSDEQVIYVQQAWSRSLWVVVLPFTWLMPVRRSGPSAEGS
ncbi:MAG: hypothetical protein ACRDHF_02255 [Tepidiformaceae bacterium]